MATGILGWFIAAVCLVALVAVWLSASIRELLAKKQRLDDISEQVALHRKLCMRERGGEHDAAAQNMLSSKLMVYREVARDYNALLKKPMHRIPSLILGLHPEGGAGEG